MFRKIGFIIKQKKIVIGIVLLCIFFAATNIFMVQGKAKSEKNADISFQKVTERSLNNTKLISGQVKPGNIESFYADPTKGKVKDIAVKEGQEVEKGTKLFSYDNEEINLQLKQAA
ncbi:biotin/lipoyl-binding protein, partial [Bacillus sp. Xin1]